MQSTRLLWLAVLSGVSLLAGCDMLGIESASASAARREAEGRAIGGACRHAGRALEDCYTLNKRFERAAIFAGWREMNDYMRENKVDTVQPQLPPPSPPSPPRGEKGEKAEKAEEPAKSARPAKG